MTSDLNLMTAEFNAQTAAKAWICREAATLIVMHDTPELEALRTAGEAFRAEHESLNDPKGTPPVTGLPATLPMTVAEQAQVAAVAHRLAGLHAAEAATDEATAT